MMAMNDATAVVSLIGTKCWVCSV